MLNNKTHVTFLAFLATVGCGPAGNENGSLPVASRSNAVFWPEKHKIACRSCNLNGSGIYEDAQFINYDYGMLQHKYVEPYTLLGFENLARTVKANWGLVTWEPGYSYTYTQTDVTEATYGGNTYSVKSITTDASNSNVWDRTKLSVVLVDAFSSETTVSGSNLANLVITMESPVTASSSYMDLKIGTEHYHALGDNHAVNQPGTLTGYEPTYRKHGTSEAWKSYCDVGHNDGETSVPDYMVPFSGARIGDSHADITADSDYVTFGCLKGAFGWALDWGWHPWISGMSWNAFGAVVQGKRAAFCGRESYTNNSVSFRHADNLSPHVEDPNGYFGLGMGQHLESWWTQTQATCLKDLRDPMAFPFDLMGDDNWCSLSACSSTPGTWYFVTAACW